MLRNCRTFRLAVSFRAMRRDIVFALRSSAFVLILGACARQSAVSPPGASPAAVRAPDSSAATSATPATLPPIPLVDGPLAVRVVYPTPGALITSRDSNFIFGSVGSGRATLEINGTPVKVHPNGAFLGFLPVPAADAPRYLLRVRRDTDTATMVHPVRLLPPPVVLSDSGPLVVDSASVQPRVPMTLRPSERVRVAVRAPANARVSLVWAGGSQPLVSDGLATGAARDTTEQRLALAGRDALRWSTDIPAPVLTRGASLVITRGADTVLLPLTAPSLDSVPGPRMVMLGPAAVAAGDRQRAVVGRSVPDAAGTSRWFLIPGTLAELTGRVGAFARIRLDDQLEIWVDSAEVRSLQPGVAAARPTILSARVTPSAEWVDLVLPMAEPVPFLVEEHPRSFVLTLYGARASVDVIAFAQNDSLIRTVQATQVATDRAQVTVHLAAAPYGYQPLWETGRFILRVRRPPAVDRDRPLRGLTIAVDPGHPPIGATGPTGFYEGDATLMIGERMKRLLEERGATVFMTRTTRDPVALGDRAPMATRANAHAFVSIHLNAYPDGVNPYTSPATGTGMYYYYPHSERLARALQTATVPELGLRNVGIFQQSFAVIRNSWMPAVLAEGAFLMIPEQEAALRTAEYQEAYARGLVNGLERFFRAMGDER